MWPIRWNIPQIKASPHFGAYTLTLRGGANGIGSTTLVPATAAIFTLDVGEDFTPTYIPVGDFNNGGQGDFIGGVRSTLFGNQLLVYFGEDAFGSTAFARPDLIIDVNLYDPDQLNEIVTAGDFNADQISDLAIIDSAGTVRIFLGRDNASLAQLPKTTVLKAPAGIPTISAQTSDVVISNHSYKTVLNVGNQDQDSFGAEDLF